MLSHCANWCATTSEGTNSYLPDRNERKSKESVDTWKVVVNAARKLLTVENGCVDTKRACISLDGDAKQRVKRTQENLSSTLIADHCTLESSR